MGRGPPYPFPPSMSISPASSVNIRDNVSVNSSTESEISNICQLDGGNSVNNTFNTSDESFSDDGDNDMTEYLTDDEIEHQTEPINISPVTKPNKRQLKILKASSFRHGRWWQFRINRFFSIKVFDEKTKKGFL